MMPYYVIKVKWSCIAWNHNTKTRNIIDFFNFSFLFDPICIWIKLWNSFYQMPGVVSIKPSQNDVILSISRLLKHFSWKKIAFAKLQSGKFQLFWWNLFTVTYFRFGNESEKRPLFLYFQIRVLTVMKLVLD